MHPTLPPRLVCAQLLYEDGDGELRRYEYQKGRAIAFGSGFRHSSEPGLPEADAAHAFLCFTFGSDEPAHWEAIAKTINTYQSRMLARPDGTLHLTELGEHLHQTGECVAGTA